MISPTILKNKINKFRDISTDGISFYIDEEIPKSSYIEAEIYLGINITKFIGQAIWYTKLEEYLYEVGIKFIDISRKNLNIIKGLNK